MKNKRIVFIGLLLVALAVPLAAGHLLADDRITDIEAALDVPWLALLGVSMEETEGATVVTVAYMTQEVNPVAYRAEMIEVYRLVASIDDPNETVTIALAPHVNMGDSVQGIELATVSMASVLDMATGDITRTTFLDEIEITPLEHSQQQEQNPA
jgi:hypothetical protein